MDKKYLCKHQLGRQVPYKEYRMAWARASLLMLPQPSRVSTYVPLPIGKPPAKVSIRAPQVASDPYEWRWILDTALYPFPPRKNARLPSSKENYDPNTTRASH